MYGKNNGEYTPTHIGVVILVEIKHETHKH